MKRLLLAYNPNSGSKSFKNELDECVRIFQEAGFYVSLLRFSKGVNIGQLMSSIDKDFFDTVVACGGDGTINIVLNAIMKNDIKTKLGIIPAGTANDFATYLKIDKDPTAAAKIIAEGKTKLCDVGLANDRYFINVFAAGLLTNISQQVDKDFKPFLGKLAYYLKGIEQVPNFVPIPVKITNSTETIEENIYLFFLLNSSGTGGFENLSKSALIDDGKFDFIAIRARPLVEVAVLFVKILKGDYLEDPNVLYFKDSYIKVECLSENPWHSVTDIDGEEGPYLPVEVSNISKCLKIIIP